MEQVTDISIDLETLSTAQDAAILSIGATKFNRHTGEIGETFYIEVDIDDAMKYGSVSGSTLAWWMQQGDSAKRLFRDAGADVDNLKWSLYHALHQLHTFIDENYGGVCVWGNGATFDISILEHAYSGVGFKEPWAFWNIRDLRTLVDAASELGFDKGAIQFAGTAHNAKDDAIHQAKIAIAAWNVITAKREVPA